ncbi:MAG: hypothetical protein HYZ53_02845 [Planctomycetes bacterium]|nr:hypothetical protein [Planctomycetota bacterium]
MRLEVVATPVPVAGRNDLQVAVEGAAPLPDRTLLLACLRFSGRICPESWARCEVLDGRFRLQLGPFRRRALAGRYEVAVRFSPSDQAPSLAALLAGAAPADAVSAFQFGPPEAEQAEAREEKAYVADMLSRLKALYDDLEAKSRAFRAAEAKFKQEEFRAWVTAAHRGLEEAAKVNARWGPASVVSPRYPDSVEDLAALARLLRYMFRQYARELAEKYNCLGELPSFAEPVSGLALLAQECVEEVGRRCREVEERERFVARPPECFDLYRDLLEFEELGAEREARARAEAAERAAAAKNGGARPGAAPLPGGAEDRSAWLVAWKQRLERLAGSVDRYRGSALVEGFPDFEARWRDLVEGLRDLAGGAAGGRAAGGREGGPAGRVARGREYLSSVIEAERRRACEAVQRDLKDARDLARELDERLAASAGGAGAAGAAAASARAKAAWAAWGGGWLGRLTALDPRLKAYAGSSTLRFFFPQAAHAFRVAADCLRRAYEEGTLAAAGSPSAKHGERVPYYRRTRDEVLLRVEEELRRQSGPR